MVEPEPVLRSGSGFSQKLPAPAGSGSATQLLTPLHQLHIDHVLNVSNRESSLTGQSQHHCTSSVPALALEFFAQLIHRTFFYGHKITYSSAKGWYMTLEADWHSNHITYGTIDTRCVTCVMGSWQVFNCSQFACKWTRYFLPVGISGLSKCLYRFLIFGYCIHLKKVFLENLCFGSVSIILRIRILVPTFLLHLNPDPRRGPRNTNKIWKKCSIKVYLTQFFVILLFKNKFEK